MQSFDREFDLAEQVHAPPRVGIKNARGAVDSFDLARGEDRVMDLNGCYRVGATSVGGANS